MTLYSTLWQVVTVYVIIGFQTTTSTKRGFSVKALLDCGVTGCYIDDGFVMAKSLPSEWLPRPVPVYNADGMHNKGGPITCTATLQLWIKDHMESFQVHSHKHQENRYNCEVQLVAETQPKCWLEYRRYYIWLLPIRVWNAFSWCGRGRGRARG